MVGVIEIFLGNHLASCLIRATITPTSRIIQEQDNYNFVLTSDIADYGTNTILQIGFPTDYDFSSQTPTSLAKICDPVRGIITSVLFDELECSLDKESRILTVDIVYGTTNREIEFTVNNITNPTYSGLTNTFSIFADDPANSRNDTGGNNVFVTAVTGVLAAELASANDTVGKKEALTVNITQSHLMPADGVVIAKFPKWNPSSSNPISVLSGTQIQCETGTGFTSQKIDCTFTQNLTSADAIDTLTITGDFSVAQSNIIFTIYGFLNPPSTTSYTSISLTTSASDTTDQLDTLSSIPLPITSPNPLDSSNIVVTVDTDSLKINTAGIYNFVITLEMPMTGGSSFTLTFPNTLTVSANPTVTAVENLNAGFTSAYDAIGRVLTVSNAVAAGGNLNEGQSITFTVDSVTTPDNTEPTASIEYRSFDGSGGAIEICDTGVSITATPGEITAATAVPVDTTVEVLTRYTITFTPESIVPSGAIIKIIFPDTIKATNRSNSPCVSAATNINAGAQCTVTNDKEMVITSGFSADLAAGTVITFQVSDITNYQTSETSAVFGLETRTSADFVIDSYQGTTMTASATPSTFTEMNVTSAALVTGVENTYTFDFNFEVDSVLANSILDITFPAEITILDPNYSANTCNINTGILNSIACEFTEPQKLRITQLFNDSRFLNRSFSIEIEDIKNPRSLLQSSSFELMVLDANGNSQKSLTTGKMITATTASDFQSISVVPGSEANGATNDYLFSITLSNNIEAGEFIRVVFPTDQITPSSANSECRGVTYLATTLTCAIIGFEVEVTVAAADGTTPITSGTLIEFQITNIQNPPTLQASNSIQVISFLQNAGTDYVISQRTSGLTITNSERGAISDASAVPDDTGLSVTTNYTITFLPTNPLPQNSIILVKIPEEISINNIAAISCTSETYIEASLTCTYEPANRIVTVSNGFAANTNYVASTIAFKIFGLTNPPNAVTTQSFTIETKDATEISIDYISTGVTYTKLCTSPCLTCENDLSNCTSCSSTSAFPYLHSNTCVASCPAGYYKDADESCKVCQSPCLTCEESENQCLSCITSPYKVLYGFACVDSCPRFYTEENQKCELLTESLIPFLFLIIWASFFLLLVFLKIMKSHTLFFSTLVCWTCFLLNFLWVLVDVYLFAEGFTISGLVMLGSIFILYCINLIWGVSYYRNFIKKKDAFYFKYVQSYPKTELFVHAFMYLFNFQMLRIALSRFIDVMAFSGSLHKHKVICRVMNIFTTALILLVLLPIAGINIFAMATLDLSRTALFHNIECMILTLFLTFMLLAEIFSGNKINTYDSFLIKSSYEKTVDQLDRYGDPSGKRNISLAALGRRNISALSVKIGSRKERDLGLALAHYRYSELPSPTNEINLVSFEKPHKKKDPRLTSSYPCSPKTAKIAWNKFQNNLDEANISADDDLGGIKMGIPVRKHLSNKKQKEVRKKLRLRQSSPAHSYADSSNSSSSGSGSDSGSSSSGSLSQELPIAKRAVRGAIRAQSPSQNSSRSTQKARHLTNYQSKKILKNDHITLTKLKKEIYENKSRCTEIMDLNKGKRKEKKELQERLEKVKQELEDLMNSKETYDTENDTSSFVEQKAVQVTSVANDLSEEESKRVIGDIMKHSTSSGVETDYIRKVNDRRIYNAARAENLVNGNSISSSFSKSRKLANSKDFASTNEFYGPNKPLPQSVFAPKIVSETISDNPMTSIDAEGMGIVFPPTMETFKPVELKMSNQEEYLKQRLPQFQNPGGRKSSVINYRPNRGYFQPAAEEILTSRSRKSKSNNTTARKGAKGSKTHRSGKAGSRFPVINHSKGPDTSQRDSQNHSFFKKSDLDITDSSMLEKAYKNILPKEERMLNENIEVRRTGRIISNERPSISKGARKGKKFFKNRFKSVDPNLEDVDGTSDNSRLTPMQRRKKWKGKNMKNRSKKRS